MSDGGVSYEDELAVKASDLVAAEADERVWVGIVAPFSASAARVAARNAAVAMARVMWAYQASPLFDPRFFAPIAMSFPFRLGL